MNFFRLNAYMLIFLLSLAPWSLLIFTQADLSVPFYYLSESIRFKWLNFDVNLYLVIIKNIIEGGDYLSIDFLGFPENMDFRLYPFSLPMGILKFSAWILSFFHLSFGQSANLIFIFSFPFNACCFYFLTQSFALDKTLSILFAVLYAYIPYHFHVGQMHFALSFYGATMILLGLVARISFQKNSLNKTDIMYCVLVAFLAANTDLYIIFFSILSLFFLSFIVFLEKSKQSKKIIHTSSLITFFILFFTCYFMYPAIIFKMNHPEFLDNTERKWEQTEFWGFKIAQAFLPIREHFLTAFDLFSQKYNSVYPFAHVNESVAMGCLGSVGFALTILYIFFKRKKTIWLHRISALTLLLVLFSTVGGLGTLFSLFFSPYIRSFYRVAPILSGLSFLFILLAIQASTFFSKWKKFFILGSIFFFLDQTGNLAIPQFREINANYYKNDNFFSQFQKWAEKHSKVFILPMMDYPEGAPSASLLCYEQFIPYLHTKNIYYNYGIHKVSPKWQEIKEWQKLSPQQFSKKLCAEKFSIILIDKHGFHDEKSFQDTINNFSKQNLATLSGERYYAFKICP